MKKTSLGQTRVSRSSKGPRRVSNRESSRRLGPQENGTSSNSGTNGEGKCRSNIPISKLRGSSADRESRPRVRASELSSTKKRRSRSHATPSTPSVQHWEGAGGFSSVKAPRSRSGSRCGSSERSLRFAAYKGKPTDLRPLKEPAFQQQAMARVYNYFQRQRQGIRNLCPMPHTRSIMIQSFVEMMSHLLQTFFGNHGVYKKNYTEEIPKLMKRLEYPGNLSTSWLKTVNAPHAWPYVVAILSWLVDLVVDFEQTTIDDFFPPSTSEHPDKVLIFKLYLDSYAAWNAEDDGKAEEIDKDLCIALKEAQGFSEEDVENLAAEIRTLKKELNDPVELHAIEEYETLFETVKTLSLKEEDFIVTNKKLAASIDGMHTEVEVTKHHCTRLEQELESKRRKMQELTQIINTQSMSVEESLAIKEKIKNIRIEIANNDEYLLNLEKIQCADDLKMASVKRKLNKMCVEFNTEILQSNIPELETLAFQTNLNFCERDLPKAVSETERISACLQQLRVQFVEKVKAIDLTYCKREQVMKDLKAERKKLQDKMQICKKECSVLEHDIETVEAELEKKDADFISEYNDFQIKTKKLVSSMPNIDDLNAELVQLRAQEAESQRILEQSLKNCTEYLRTQVEACEEYKRQSYLQLAALKDFLVNNPSSA